MKKYHLTQQSLTYEIQIQWNNNKPECAAKRLAASRFSPNQVARQSPVDSSQPQASQMYLLKLVGWAALLSVNVYLLGCAYYCG